MASDGVAVRCRTVNDKPARAATMNETQPCAFCQLPTSRIVASNDLGMVVRDGFPVSPGHTLIIARRHVGSFFDLAGAEREGLLALLDAARAQMQQEMSPDGFNIGINDGPAAGQTMPHLHIHLIPRYKGDVPDPRGGVRWVIADKADYWTRQ